MTFARTTGLAAALAAVCIAPGAATPYAPYYIDQNTIDNVLETKGFAYHNRNVNVEAAICRGRARYGVRTSALGANRYWRFTCDALSVNQNYYTLEISTTTSPNSGGWYWHLLSARLEY